jgi:hypothetical protein
MKPLTAGSADGPSASVQHSILIGKNLSPYPLNADEDVRAPSIVGIRFFLERRADNIETQKETGLFSASVSD